MKTTGTDQQRPKTQKLVDLRLVRGNLGKDSDVSIFVEDHNGEGVFNQTIKHTLWQLGQGSPAYSTCKEQVRNKQEFRQTL